MSIAAPTPRLIAAEKRWQQICGAPDDAFTIRQSMDAEVDLYRAEYEMGLYP